PGVTVRSMTRNPRDRGESYTRPRFPRHDRESFSGLRTFPDAFREQAVPPREFQWICCASGVWAERLFDPPVLFVRCAVAQLTARVSPRPFCLARAGRSLCSCTTHCTGSTRHNKSTETAAPYEFLRRGRYRANVGVEGDTLGSERPHTRH